jgi:transglutaminase-like putative cysteine protease
LTVAAGVAAGLGTAPIGALFDGVTWMFPAAAAIAAVTSFQVLARIMRLPPAVVPAAGALGLLLFLCFGYAQSGNFAVVVPTGHSLALLREGLRGGFQDVQTYAAPAPTTPGLLLVLTLTAGLMCIVVDTLAVAARRPAVAGLVMLALYAVPTAIRNAPVPWPYFVAGAVGYMVLLLAEERERLMRWGRPVTHTDPSWQGDPAPIRFSGRQVGMGALAVAVLVPLFVPGISASGLSGLGAGTGDGPGNGTRIDPFAALKGNLTQGGKPVELLQLSADYPDVHYVRTQVLDVFTNRGWVPSNPSGTGPADGEVTTKRYGASREYSAKVQVTGYSDKYLPIPSGTLEISGVPRDENWLYDDQRAMVFSTAGVSSGKKYQVQVAEPAPTVATLEQSEQLGLDSPAMQEAGTVPAYSPRFPVSVRNKVEDLIKGKETPYDKAKAIRDYFSPSNGFSYSVSTAVGDTGSELADFVLQKKQGYCQQYAASMAIMLRIAHVPARVVLGFTRHSPPVGDGYWPIYNTDAHAWVEAYFDALGWIPFDPTPPDPTAPGRMAGFGSWDPPYQSPLPLPTGAGSAGPSDVPTGGPVNKPLDTTHDPAALGDRQARLTPAGMLTVLGILVVLLILASPGLIRVVQRRRRLVAAGQGDAGPAARAAWDELLATAVDLNVALRPEETPRAVARRLVAELSLAGPPAAGLRLLALAEERARYARVAYVDGDLPTAVRAVRRGLAANQRRRRRVLAAAMPPSVLQAARRSLARRNLQVSGQIDRLGTDLRRPLRPRRSRA